MPNRTVPASAIGTSAKGASTGAAARLALQLPGSSPDCGTLLPPGPAPAASAAKSAGPLATARRTSCPGRGRPRSATTTAVFTSASPNTLKSAAATVSMAVLSSRTRCRAAPYPARIHPSLDMKPSLPPLRRRAIEWT